MIDFILVQFDQNVFLYHFLPQYEPLTSFP